MLIYTLVNDLSAAQFVTINVDGTVTSNDTVDVGGGLRACVLWE